MKSIRILPDLPRASHTIRFPDRTFTFLKGKWYQTSDEELIERCKKTRLHFENPKSPLLFEVLDKTAALAVHRAETEKKEPSATPDDPVVLDVLAAQAEVQAAQAEVARLGEQADATLLAAQAEREAAEKALAEARQIMAAAEEAKQAAEEIAAEAMKVAPPAPAADEPPPAEPKGGKGGGKR